MARKYTSFKYIGSDADKAEIRRILKLHYGDKKFAKFYYTRDDRIIDLDTETVYCESDYVLPSHDAIAFTFGHSSDDIAADALENAVWDSTNQRLTIKEVYSIEDQKKHRNGMLSLGVRNHTILSLTNEHVDWAPVPKSDKSLSERIRDIEGAEWIADGMSRIENAYQNIPTNDQCLFKVWLFINKFDLYDVLCEYSTFIYMLSQSHLSDSIWKADDFFEAINVAPEFKFMLSNEYLTMKSKDIWWGQPAHLIDRLSYSYQMFCLIESEKCKTALLNGAELKYFDLAISDTQDSTEMSLVAQTINIYPEFFIDYVLSPSMIRPGQNILKSFYMLCQDLLKQDITPSKDGVTLLSYKKKADRLGVDIRSYQDIIQSLNTKDGLIAFFKGYN